MARFMSVHDRNFRSVLSRLNKFREGIVKGVDSVTHGQPGTRPSGPRGTYVALPSSCVQKYLLNYFRRLHFIRNSYSSMQHVPWKGRPSEQNGELLSQIVPWWSWSAYICYLWPWYDI